jgi:hypothetical protein
MHVIARRGAESFLFASPRLDVAISLLALVIPSAVL